MSAPPQGASNPNPLDLYEPLEVIGNGSFGIIRKVRRKADGEILARKELNFERMSERDRKQIVAEVNILKDLHHDNIVRYIDRFVDRERGILYILMEYCDGGDLTSVIKQCARNGRALPEDTVWSYFLQLLLALQHCHFPNTKPGEDASAERARQQILHRDLKPENIFISKGNTIKLGDFGLSKALTQTSFANTYVGTPYYMSPELIQEKSYDTKSDIWSLGCLIYELCALKPPFHEAQTHSELSMLIRNGRIPPLPKGYSHALSSVIKSMLNLNPAMRPSAQQLLQHERIDFARKVADTEKTIAAVKAHKANVLTRERELQNQTAALAQREAALSTVVNQKDAEISRLTTLVNEASEKTKRAVATREEELRLAVMRREEEVRTAMARREEEILEAVRKREEEINSAWKKREEQLKKELQSAIHWVQTRQKEIVEKEGEIESTRKKLANETEELQQAAKAQRKEKMPLDEIKNYVAPSKQVSEEKHDDYEATPRKPSPPSSVTFETPSANLHRCRSLESPATVKHAVTAQQPAAPVPGSAMRGVILTATGEALKTPAPFTNTTTSANAALTNIIKNTPAIGLNFRKIFNFEDSDSETDDADTESVTATAITTSRSYASSACSVPDLNSPTKNVKCQREKLESTSSSEAARVILRRRSSTKTGLPAPKLSLSPQKATAKKSNQVAQVKVRRLSRPSVGRALMPKSASTPTLSNVTRPSKALSSKKQTPPTPRYDPSDEENLPSPFLRRVERAKTTRVSGIGAMTRVGTARRKSNALRAKVAANSATTAQGRNGANVTSTAKES